MKPLLALVFVAILVVVLVPASQLGGSEDVAPPEAIGSVDGAELALEVPATEPANDAPRRAAWDFRAVVEPTLPPTPPNREAAPSSSSSSTA